MYSNLQVTPVAYKHTIQSQKIKKGQRYPALVCVLSLITERWYYSNYHLYPQFLHLYVLPILLLKIPKVNAPAIREVPEILYPAPIPQFGQG